MSDERYPRGDYPQRGPYGRNDQSDYGQDHGATEDRYMYSSARDYRAAGMTSDRGGDYGARDYGRDQQRNSGRERSSGWNDDQRYSGRSQNYGGGEQYSGGQSQGARDYGRDPYRQARGTFDRQPQGGRDHEDRGFIARAGDEVRSWFGDEEAEHRREADARRDGQGAGRGQNSRDDHYHSWRSEQIASFDRDYDEYRQENQSKFHNEFSSWRTQRQGQRDLLRGVEEHAEVVGSDGEHVGTVDKVRGDRIILTKKDPDAGGHHHSVPSSWLQSADSGKVTLRKTAAEAKAHWRDEERQGGSEQQGSNRSAMFGREGEQQRQSGEGSTNLNRSFSGTY